MSLRSKKDFQEMKLQKYIFILLNVFFLFNCSLSKKIDPINLKYITIANDTRRAFLLAANKPYSMNLKVPNKEFWLNISFSINPEIYSELESKMKFLVCIKNGKELIKIEDKTINLSKNQNEPLQWFNVKHNLVKYGGKEIEVILKIKYVSGLFQKLRHQEIGCFTYPKLIAGKNSTDKPNIILISLDTCRADRLSCYNYDIPTSPFLDSLAKNGVLFLNAFTQAPCTPPAHASMLTGLYPSRTGLFIYPLALDSTGSQKLIEGYYVDEDVTSLATTLSENNYLTAAFTGGGYVSHRLGLNKGFFSFVENQSPTSNDLLQNYSDAINWIKKNNELKFFLFFHTYEIHKPYNHNYFWSIKQYEKKYKEEYNTPDDSPEKNAKYDSGILFTDFVLSEFFRELLDLGLLNDCFVIITSDHGETLGEHFNIIGYNYNHGGSFFDEEIKIPLIFYFPSKFHPKKINNVVGLIDIVPTILDVLTIEYDLKKIDGDSLLPLIYDKQNDNNNFRNYIFIESPSAGPARSCIRTDKYKLIKVIDRKEITKVNPNEILSNHPNVLFYELEKDPKEKNNIYLNGYKKEIENLNNLMNMLNNKHNIQKLLSLSIKEKKEILTQEEIEKLKSLGYIK